MKFTLELELEEESGRWIAEIPEAPGVMVYGKTPQEAGRDAFLLLMSVLIDKIRHGELATKWGPATTRESIDLPLVSA